MSTTPQKVVSSAWYILPILLGIIGGIIAWLVNRDDDPVKARKFLILGVIFLVLEILVYVALYGVLFASLMRF